MKSSEDLRLIVKLKRAYKGACDFSLWLCAPRNIERKQNINPIIAIPKARNARESSHKNQSKMSLSDRLSLWSGILWFGSAFVGVLAGVITIWGLREARKDAKISSDALGKYKRDSNERIELLKRETAGANERTAQVYRKLGPRYITPSEMAKFSRDTQGMDRNVHVLVAGEDSSDLEIRGFARDIARTLHEAGFKVEFLDPVKWPDPPFLPLTGRMKAPSGVRIQRGLPDPSGSIFAWAHELNEALYEIGIPTGVVSTTRPIPSPENGCVVIVGSKPEEKFEPSR